MQEEIVDIHSHLYPELYIDHMMRRTVEPCIREVDGTRMFVIFPGEPGRPMDATYWDIGEKLAYMDEHGITRTVLSLGNPWLDPIGGAEGVALARELNGYFGSLGASTEGRIVGMGVLPSSSVEDAIAVAREIAATAGLCGVIVGSRICGMPLDDPSLVPLWEALSDAGVPVLLHPHYGIGLEHMEGFGHVLPLALAFTFETTTALARLVLSGAFERAPNLRIVGAHGGGTLPFLAGRLDACWRPDPVARSRSGTAPAETMRRLYLDALVYDTRSLRTVSDLIGASQMAFGTDHPFSIADADENLEAIRKTFSDADARAILYGTPARLFGLSEGEEPVTARGETDAGGGSGSKGAVR